MLVKKEDTGLQTIAQYEEIATKMVQSGFLPVEINTAQKAIAIAMKGRELGIPATQALSEIYVVKGKASLKSELMLQLATERIPGFYHNVLHADDTKCTIEFHRNGRAPFIFSYTMDQAIKAGLANGETYKKYGFYMLFNRCASFGLKMFCPDYKSIVMEIDLSDEATAEEAIRNVTEVNGTNVDTDTGEVLKGDPIVDAEIVEIPKKEEAPNPEAPKAEENKSGKLFDDDKKKEKTEKKDFKCEDCEAKITGNVLKYSIDKHGHALCFDCQKKMGGK